MTNVETIRRFSRSFTRAAGLLEKSYLGRGRPLAASRLIFEIGVHGAELRTLRGRMGFDSGYLTRLLDQLRRQGLVRVDPAENDARVRIARLTEAGHAERDELDRLSDKSIRELLEGVHPARREEFVTSFRSLERILGATQVVFEKCDVRDPRCQASLAAYFAELARRFPQGFDPGDDAEGRQFLPPRGTFLLAKIGSDHVGCGGLVFFDDFVEIKRMWVDPDYRGIGIAGRLLAALEEEGARCGAGILRLDTNGILTEARALYARAGYREIARYNDNPYAEYWYEKSLDEFE